MTQNGKVRIGLLIVALVAVVAVTVVSASSTLFQGNMRRAVMPSNTNLIKGHYFEYFKGQPSEPFYTVKTAQSSLGGKIVVLNESNQPIKTICTLNPGLGGGCSWDGTNNDGEQLPLSVEKFKFRVSVLGPNGAEAVVESPLFLYDTTGI